MAARNSEAPMDYKWDDSIGPMDPNSPFLQGTRQEGFHSPTRLPNFASLGPQTSPIRLGSSRTFNYHPQTPTSKPSFNINHFSGIRDNRDFDVSSGAENNQSSPDNADNEDTPDAPRTKLNENVTMFRGHTTSPSRGSAAAALAAYKSGRGEISKKKHGGGVLNRGYKRKRQEVNKDRYIARQSSYDSDFEDRSRPSSSEGPSKSTSIEEVGYIAALFNYIHQRPDLPHTLSVWVQFLLNFFLVAAFIYAFYQFWSTIRNDVEIKAEEAISDIMAEMEHCAREYVENRCDRSSRVPAMEMVCNNWEKCMNKDPRKVGRARVSAQTFAEIMDSFVRPMSSKLMICLTALVVLLFTLPNVAFGYFRSKASPPSQQTQYYQQQDSYIQGKPQQGLRIHSPQKHEQTQYSQGEYFPIPRLGENYEGFETAAYSRARENQTRSPSKRIGYS